MLGVVGAWPTGELLGLDFETTGIDRFNDVPVSYALVSVVEGVLVRAGPASSTPAVRSRWKRPRPWNLDGTGAVRACRSERRCPLVSDAVVAVRRGVPLAGMKLDYDLTILETQTATLRMGTHTAGVARPGTRRRRHRSPLRSRP